MNDIATTSEHFLFRKTLDRLGLSASGAADYLNVSEKAIDNWITGRVFAPIGMYIELKHLYESQLKAAEAAYSKWVENHKHGEVSFIIADSDLEAQEMGWPCMGSQYSAVALFQLMIAPATVFPGVRSPESHIRFKSHIRFICEFENMPIIF